MTKKSLIKNKTSFLIIILDNRNKHVYVKSRFLTAFYYNRIQVLENTKFIIQICNKVLFLKHCTDYLSAQNYLETFEKQNYTVNFTNCRIRYV